MISFSITQDVVLTDLNDDFPIALNGNGVASKFDRPKRVPLELLIGTIGGVINAINAKRMLKEKPKI